MYLEEELCARRAQTRRVVMQRLLTFIAFFAGMAGMVLAGSETIYSVTVTSDMTSAETAYNCTGGTVTFSEAPSTYTDKSITLLDGTTISSTYSLKLDGKSDYVLLSLSNGTTLQAGDSIYIGVFATDKGNEYGVTLKASTESTTGVTCSSTVSKKTTVEELPYVVTESDELYENSNVYVYRTSGSVYFYSARIVRPSGEDGDTEDDDEDGEDGDTNGGTTEEEEDTTATDSTAAETTAWDKIAFFEFETLTTKSNTSGTSTSSSEITVSGCTVLWSSIQVDNAQTANGDNYYKFSGDDAYITIELTDDSFAAGDSVVFDIINTSNTAHGVIFGASNKTITGSSNNKNNAESIGYVLTASDIDSGGAITVSRSNSSVYIHGASVYRYPQPSVTITASIDDECAVGDEVTLTATLANITSGTLTWKTVAGSDTTVVKTAENLSDTTAVDTIDTKGEHVYYCEVATGDTTVVSNTVTITGVSLYTPVLTSILSTGDTLTSDGDTTFVPMQYTSVKASIASKTTNATVYYTTSTTGYATYSSNESTLWTAIDVNTSTITVAPTIAGVYLTVVAVLAASDNIEAETAYAYAHYLSCYPYITFNRDSALSTLAVADTNGEPLGIKVNYVYETTTTDETTGETTTTVTTDDLTSECSFSYSSDDKTVATVDTNGTVKGVAVGTVTIKVTLTKLEGYYALSDADTASVTIAVTADYMPSVSINTEKTTISYSKLSDDDYTDIDVYEFDDDGTVYVDLATPSGDAYSNYTVFYTLDGSTPTWKNGHLYNDEPIALTHSAYIHAIAYDKVSESSSPTSNIAKADNDDSSTSSTTAAVTRSTYCNPTSIARASFHFPGTKGVYFDEGDSYDPGEQFAITGDDGDTLCIATLGSSDDPDDLWDKTASAGQIKSSRIYRFINYAIGNEDAMNEPSTFYKSSDSEVYDGSESSFTTFDAPIMGCYVMFEPKQDGEISTVLRQNGIIATYSYDGNRQSEWQNMRKRLIYVCDETGTPVDSLRAMINPNATMAVQSGADDDGNTKLINVYDSCSTTSENMPFYQKLVYSKYMTLQGYDYYDVDDEWPADSLTAAATFWEKEANSKMPYNLIYKDGKGWLTMSLTYVMYTFPVEAGKTYFMMGNRTKVGPCGFEFTPAETAEATTADDGNEDSGDDTSASETAVTIEAKTTTGVTALPSTVKGACDVTLERKFFKDVWTSLVLPFSVSPSMLQDVFGDSTEVMHFNGISDETLYLMKHYHQMIVAGTPVFIRPSKEVDCPTFENVTYGTYTYATDDNGVWYISDVSSDIPAADTTATSDNWTLQCSYIPKTTSANFYLLVYDTTDEDEPYNGFYHYTTSTTMAGTRAWLESSSTTAQIKAVSVGGVTELDDSETTGILNAVLGNDTAEGNVGSGNGNVYNINGQLVRRASDGIDGLAKGIYIVNGKKFIVK